MSNIETLKNIVNIDEYLNDALIEKYKQVEKNVLRNNIQKLDDETKTMLIEYLITLWGRESGTVYDLKLLQEYGLTNNYDELRQQFISNLSDEEIKIIEKELNKELKKN